MPTPHFNDSDQFDYSKWLNALKNQPENPKNLLDWIEGPLRNFFPFRRLYCAFGELVVGQIRVTEWVATGHQDIYLDQLSTNFDLNKRGSLKWWLENRKPFFIDPELPASFATSFEIEEIRNFDLENVAGHGILNINANSGTYFGFSGVET